MLRCIGPRPRDLEPKLGVTSGEASRKRTNRNRKPRMKSLRHSGYETQALSFISRLNRTLPQAERSWAERRSYERRSLEKKGLTETGNRTWKVSATQGTKLKHFLYFQIEPNLAPGREDLEPKDGVTSGEASKKRTNRNRKPRMKSLCHSGYWTQALSLISTLNRTLERNLFSCHIFFPKWSQISLFFCLNDDWPSMPCFKVKVQMQSKQHINKRNVILPPLQNAVYFCFSQR